MILDIESQIYGFLGGVLLGFLLGLLYDMLRPLKLSLVYYLQECLDFLYCFFLLLVLIYFAPSLSYGYLRISLVLSYALGFFLYFRLLSPLVRFLSQLWTRGTNWLIGLISRPFRVISMKCTAKWDKYFIQMKKTIKKTFSFPPLWFKIIKIPKKMGGCTHEATKDEGGLKHDEEHQAWRSH